MMKIAAVAILVGQAVALSTLKTLVSSLYNFDILKIAEQLFCYETQVST
jgi:hypothetical protein